MRERLLEDWLDKIGERGFEVPFSQSLVTKGHKILYMGHSPIEHGKDIVTRDANGRLHAYQLKQGSVDLKVWERIRPQVVALVETAAEHPNVGNERFQPWLVVSGEFTAPAVSRINSENKSWHRRGFRPLKLIAAGALLADLSALASDFWPVKLPEIQAFIDLYQKPGEALIDKAGYAKFCVALLQREGWTRSEVARRISALNIFVSYLLAKAYAAGNHWAVFEGWTLASSHIAWAAQKYGLTRKQWGESFELAQSAAWGALTSLKDEALAEKALEPRTLEWDEITRVRSTYVAGAVAAWFLQQGETADPTELARAIALVRRVIGDRRTLVWGESAIPFFVAIILFLKTTSGDRLDEVVLVSLIRAIAVSNGRRSREGVPDPYEDADSILERLLRRLKRPTRKPRMHTGRSYTLEGLIFLAARRLLKNQLETLWPAVTYVDFFKFVPKRADDFLMWHTEDGSLDSRQPGRPQSWSALLAAARRKNYERSLPALLIRRPAFALGWSLVAPQRLTTDMVMLLDDSFRINRTT